MNTIQIKTPSPEQSLPLVKEALEMEKKLTRDSLAISESRITALVRQLGVTVDQVLGGGVARGEENEQDLLDLEGELELRRTLQDTLTHLEQLKVCRQPTTRRGFALLFLKRPTSSHTPSAMKIARL
jgi:hypothetical protein